MSGQADVAPAYLKVASEYPKSAAGLQALLLAAADQFEKGKYAEAQQQFERIVREHRESPLASEAMLGVAASLDAQGKTAEATTAYKNLVDRQPNAARRVSRIRRGLGGFGDQPCVGAVVPGGAAPPPSVPDGGGALPLPFPSSSLLLARFALDTNASSRPERHGFSLNCG